MNIGERIKKLREDLGLTQEEFGERLGVTRQAIYQIEKGLRTPGIKFIVKASEVFNVPISYFLDEESLVITRDEKYYLFSIIKSLDEEERRKVLDFLYKMKGIPVKKIPVLGYVRAGEPLQVERENEPIKYLELPYDETKNVEYALIVKGDSMIDAKIYEGDYLLVNEKLQWENNSLVVAIINGKATLKRLVFDNGKWKFKPANKEYPEIELKENDDIKIIKVVKTWR